ncbi:MAG: hypothetical protein J2P17_26520 [Mycobacterium sp.]|nr:hypothetical protein [Mycobacterium sp.]
MATVRHALETGSPMTEHQILSTIVSGRTRKPPPDQVRPVRYSIIPSADGDVHAVFDRHIRAVFHDRTHAREVLRSACGRPVHPVSYLPLDAELCADCVVVLPAMAVPRPAPGTPLLRQMADLYPRSLR